MINGAHSVLYSRDPAADRAFLRDVLELSSVDVGEGWLIFALPPAEVAVHPAEESGAEELYLMCADVQAFVAEMARHDLACTPVEDAGWGLLTRLTLPGGGKLGVYQPRHARPTPAGLPAGFHALTAHLVVRDAPRAIVFYRRAFGATEKFRLEEPGGGVAHAELVIGDSLIMIAEEAPERGSPGPETLGGSAVPIHLYVEDVDAVAARAVELGAEIVIPVADQFYGDRSGRLRDPFGHLWVLATHLEEVEPAEMQRRFDKLIRGG